jgi:hypothetical protein
VITANLKFDVDLRVVGTCQIKNVAFCAGRLLQDHFFDGGTGLEILDDILPSTFVGKSLA